MWLSGNAGRPVTSDPQGIRGTTQIGNDLDAWNWRFGSSVCFIQAVYGSEWYCNIDGYKIDVTPSLTHWSYVFVALTHRYGIHVSMYLWILMLSGKGCHNDWLIITAAPHWVLCKKSLARLPVPVHTFNERSISRMMCEMRNFSGLYLINILFCQNISPSIWFLFLSCCVALYHPAWVQRTTYICHVVCWSATAMTSSRYAFSPPFQHQIYDPCFGRRFWWLIHSVSLTSRVAPIVMIFFLGHPLPSAVYPILQYRW